MTRKCDDCPSYIPSGDVQDTFGRVVNAPMCATHGYILGAPQQDSIAAQNALMHFAEDCAEYGQPRQNNQPVTIKPRVATVSEAIIEAGPTGQTLSTCHGCSNMVKPEAVNVQWGFTLPLCKAKGTLIFNPTKEAQGCSWANGGPPGDNLYDVELRREFRNDFTIGGDKLIVNLTANGNLAAEPSLYETDAPVTDEDIEEGIRAWRKLTCPYGTGKEIFLPIFDSSEAGVFSEAQRAAVPRTGDDNHPELYIDYGHLLWRFAVEEWMLDQTLLVQSFPGLGKTQFAYYLGWLMQIPVTRIFFTDSIEWDDIFGKPGFSPEEGTFWMDGRYTAAFRQIGILLVDEPNLAKSEIISTLRTSTENVKKIFLDAGYARSEGERLKLEVKAHRYNFQLWCSNPAWDPRNIGTKELAAADISRISPAYLGYPPAEIERQVIVSTVKELDDWDVPDDLLADLMKVSEDIRQASENGDFPGTWGIRENVKVARKLNWYPFVEAFRMATLNYYEPETAAFIIDNSIKTIRPDDIKRR